MRDRYGAELYLLESRARGTAHEDSDSDLVAAASESCDQPDLFGALGRRHLRAEAGGYGISSDLHCCTTEEFAQELQSLGYIGEAFEQGKLRRVPLDIPDTA